MKNLFTLVCFALILGTSFAQEQYSFYDYDEAQLSNTDSIPDFQLKEQKIKITGTIFHSDGVTPAKDVVLYIEQPDENGRYEVIKEDEKRYILHRGWVKTNANGQYTFYTFMPGTVNRSNDFKHIHPVIKEPGKPEYDLNAFLFDNDPMLTRSCRKRLAKRGLDNTILKVTTKDSMLVATKDIVLSDSALENK